MVAERLRRLWVVLGDPKAITRDVTRYLLALSVSYGRHRRRTRIASDDRGGAGEGGVPLLFRGAYEVVQRPWWRVFGS